MMEGQRAEERMQILDCRLEIVAARDFRFENLDCRFHYILGI
jgi:hypothetical protein